MFIEVGLSDNNDVLVLYCATEKYELMKMHYIRLCNRWCCEFCQTSRSATLHRFPSSIIICKLL